MQVEPLEAEAYIQLAETGDKEAVIEVQDFTDEITFAKVTLRMEDGLGNEWETEIAITRVKTPSSEFVIEEEVISEDTSAPPDEEQVIEEESPPQPITDADESPSADQSDEDLEEKDNSIDNEEIPQEEFSDDSPSEAAAKALINSIPELQDVKTTEDDDTFSASNIAKLLLGISDNVDDSRKQQIMSTIMQARL